LVVTGRAGGMNAPQMRLAEDRHLIQALVAQRPD
jgi:hypothetical protein